MAITYSNVRLQISNQCFSQRVKVGWEAPEKEGTAGPPPSISSRATVGNTFVSPAPVAFFSFLKTH